MPSISNLQGSVSGGGVNLTFDVGVNDGVAYAVAVPAGDPEPSHDQIRAGTDSADSPAPSGFAAISGYTGNLIAIGGLDTTSYDFHVFYDDADALASTFTLHGSVQAEDANPAGFLYLTHVITGDQLFDDEFATGDLSTYVNGPIGPVTWSSFQSNTAVIADSGNHTGYCLRFNVQPYGSDSWAERRFQLGYEGQYISEWWFRIRIKFPSTLCLNNGPQHGNNNAKIFKIWSGGNWGDGQYGYGDDHYISYGMEFRPLSSGDTVEYYFVCGDDGGTGTGPHDSPWLTGFYDVSEDAGQEREYVYHYKFDTESGGVYQTYSPGEPDASGNASIGNGVCEVWKDGVKIYDLHNIMAAPYHTDSPGANYCYLYGYWNWYTDNCGNLVQPWLVRQFSVALTNVFGVVE